MYGKATRQSFAQTFRREIIGQIVVITLEIESLDAGTAQQVGACVEAAFPLEEPVVIDLGELRYFDAGGFAAILSWVAGDERKHKIRLCSHAGSIRALFQLLRAPAVVQLYASRDEAMRSLHFGDGRAGTPEVQQRIA